MKHVLKNTSVKWKIFAYFMAFGAIMLALLWVFQVQFLDEFYKVIKTNAIKDATADINASLLDTNYKEQVDEIARTNDLCVVILDDQQSEIYTSNRRDPRCMIDSMKASEISQLYEEALDNGGNATRLITTDENRREWIENEGKTQFPIEDPSLHDNTFMKGRKLQNMTYASILKMTQDQSVIVLINAEISPVDATVGTIRSQLMIITIILFLLAILLAAMMSRKISKPLIKINESAKQLAKGQYEVVFDGKGYLEVSELNDTLTYAAKELNKVQTLQRELIANMSHDLRTPLTMISGYGEMMRDIPGENTPENVQIIIDESNRLNGLVNDILDLSKLQSGVQELHLETFSLTSMIKELIERYQKMIENDGYEIDFTYDEDLEVCGDKIKLHQVIYNLMNNAITYTGEDRKVIILQEKMKNGVRISICDHGPGIAREELPYVWERYYKSKQHHIRASVGTGLGLSIVKNILELHKAKYGVRSELQKGTTFWIELPKKS